MVTCPVCNGAIDVDEEDVDEGDTVSCDECGADLKVVSTCSLELESAEELEEKKKTRTTSWRKTKRKNLTRTGSRPSMQRAAGPARGVGFRGGKA